MVKEIEGLTGVKAGNVFMQKEMESFCAKFGIKPIPRRWVTGEKPEADEGVRARMVVKDIDIARELQPPGPSTLAAQRPRWSHCVCS